MTWIVYLPLRRFGFLLFDDPSYVTRNVHVRSGGGLADVLWAFTTTDLGNWHPLTWLSHMLDCRLFGLDAGFHHMTSAAIHAAATAALFLALHRMTAARWRSALVAAVFALHPLHVESVAWISERKDVLSGLLFALTLWAWSRYVERPGWPRYVASLGLFAMGLGAKPMLVTLPFVLLLLDVWPLGRFTRSTAARRLLEKLPFVGLAVGSSLVTLVAQARGLAVRSLDAYPVGPRVANAILAYAVYLRRAVWPSDLAYFYPYPTRIPFLEVAFAAMLLALITVLAIRSLARRPYVSVGWFWFVVTLVPVIGLVQVGAQSMADRYTYIPLVGLCIAAAWGLGDLATSRRYGTRWVAAAAIALVVACVFGTSRQLAFWRSDLTLTERALAVTTDNYHAHDTLGAFLAREGRMAEAMPHFEEALRIRPETVSARINLGLALEAHGRLDEAIAQYAAALRVAPSAAEAHNNLGIVLARKGNLDGAIASFRSALELRPDGAETYANLAVVEASRGLLTEAARHFEEYLRFDPDDPDVNRNLADARVRLGEVDEALDHYTKALRAQPGQPAAAKSLAWIRATYDDPKVRNGQEAVRLARIAHDADPADAAALDVLAAAYAEDGRFEEAVAAADRAVAAATDEGRPDLAAEFADRREDYASETPFRSDRLDLPEVDPRTGFTSADSTE